MNENSFTSLADVSIPLTEPENVKLFFTLQRSEDAEKKLSPEPSLGQRSSKHIRSQVQKEVGVLSGSLHLGPPHPQPQNKLQSVSLQRTDLQKHAYGPEKDNMPWTGIPNQGNQATRRNKKHPDYK